MTAEGRTGLAGAARDRQERRTSAIWLEGVGAALIGLVSFLVVVGPAPLRPENIVWLSQSPDPSTSYLGWAFYRDSPWTWPVAANPRYGLELSGSILMSDSIPLLAIPLKLFSPVLSQPFQYFGLWLLACFILQAVFGYLVARKIFSVRAEAYLATILFVFAPPFLGRFASAFHLSLCGQWVILAAALTYLSPAVRFRSVFWAALIAIGVLVNPYLLIMIGAIWLADVLRTIRAGRTPPASVYLNAATVIAVALAVAWASGVYAISASSPTTPAGMLSEGTLGQLGLYRFNLLSFFDSQGWSYFLPQRLHPGPGEYEGFSFLGAGCLLLLACAVVTAFRAPGALHLDRQHRPLLVLVFGLTLFAASPLVSIGATTFAVPWPNALIVLGGVFRSTGRFAWPAFYLTIIAALFVLARTTHRKVLTPLLLVAAIVQVGDTRAGWGHFSRSSATIASRWPSPMTSPLWKQWAGEYKNIRRVPPIRRTSPASRDLSYFALQNGLATDAVYLARLNNRGFATLSARETKSAKTGSYSSDSLWILDAATYQAVRARPPCDARFFGQVDGYLVLAPGRGRIGAGGCGK